MGNDDLDFEWSTPKFLFSIALMYIALKHGKFLDWASSFSEPWSGLLTVLVWAGTVLGYFNIVLWVIVIIVIVFLGAALLFKEVVE